MFCCTCAGSCNHVGNHTFCFAHGGHDVPRQPLPPTITFTGTSTNFPVLTDVDVDRIAQRVVERLETAGLTKKRKKR